MDRKAVTHWGAILGLITAALALLTAYFSLQEKRSALDDRQEQVAASQHSLEEQQQAYALQKKADLKAKQAEIALEQHQSLCQQHVTRIAAYEDQFSVLVQDHGLLLNAMKSCINEKKNEDRTSCTLAVCAGAYYFTNGESNCASVATEAVNIKNNIDNEAVSSRTDSCSIPSSPAQSFFNS